MAPPDSSTFSSKMLMMQSVMMKAQAGDLKAAKLVADLLSLSRSGVTTNQQVVVVQPGYV